MAGKKHDNKVREIARDEKRKGRKVQADISGYDQPRTVNGRRPDVISLDPKTGIERFIEVETPSSLKNQKDKDQRRILRNYANRSEKRRFRTVTTGSNTKKSKGRR